MDIKISFDGWNVLDASDLDTMKVLVAEGEKGDPGEPTQAMTDQAVATYLDAHPEATTTVQDGSITEVKLNSELAAKVNTVPDGSVTEQKLSASVREKLNAGGMSTEAKEALIALLEKVAYIDANGQTYLTALETALFDTYTVTNNLSNVTNSNSATTAHEGGTYTATLTPTEGLIRSVTITMGGVDVTDSVFSGTEE